MTWTLYKTPLECRLSVQCHVVSSEISLIWSCLNESQNKKLQVGWFYSNFGPKITNREETSEWTINKWIQCAALVCADAAVGEFYGGDEVLNKNSNKNCFGLWRCFVVIGSFEKCKLTFL